MSAACARLGDGRDSEGGYNAGFNDCFQLAQILNHLGNPDQAMQVGSPATSTSGVTIALAAQGAAAQGDRHACTVSFI